jgi:predicted transposase YdaD
MAQDHDARYKLLFSHPIFVRRLLESFVDLPFIGDIDFEALEQVNASFVSEEFARREADVIWKLPVAESEVYLYLLLEFQSSVDPRMPMRFLRYIVSFYESFARETKRETDLPAVFPLLLYNGDPAWTAPESVEAMIQDTIPAAYKPRLSYYPIIIRDFEAERLVTMRNAVSAVFYAEKVPPNKLIETFDQIIDIITQEVPEAQTAFTAFLRSFLRSRNVDVGHARDLREVSNMMSTKWDQYEQELAERAERRGLQKGLEKGLEEGLEKGRAEARQEERREMARRLLARGESVAEVAELTGLAESEVEKLREGA